MKTWELGRREKGCYITEGNCGQKMTESVLLALIHYSNPCSPSFQVHYMTPVNLLRELGNCANTMGTHKRQLKHDLSIHWDVSRTTVDPSLRPSAVDTCRPGWLISLLAVIICARSRESGHLRIIDSEILYKTWSAWKQLNSIQTCYYSWYPAKITGQVYSLSSAPV